MLHNILLSLSKMTECMDWPLLPSAYGKQGLRQQSEDVVQALVLRGRVDLGRRH